MNLPGRVRVLYVDDESALADRVVSTVRTADDVAAVLRETRPDAAVSALETGAVDCVLSGQDLSGTSGLALLERARSRRPGLPFVLLADTDRTVRRALRAGVTECLRRDMVEGLLSTDQYGDAGHTAENPGAVLAARLARMAEQYWRDRGFDVLTDATPGVGYRARAAPDRPFEYVAGAVEQLTGYQPAALERGGAAMTADLVHPGDTERVGSAIDAQLADGDHYELEYRLVTADDETRWVHDRGRALAGPADAPAVYEGTVVDITGRQECEQQLERCQRFVDLLPDTVVVLDESMSISHLRPPAESPADELPRVSGDDLFDYVHPEDTDAVAETVDRLHEDPGATVTVECRTRDADGGWQWAEVRAQNHLGTEPIDGIVAFVRDVTRRVEREHQLEHYGETLKTLQRTTRTLLDATDREEVARHTMTSIETVLEFEVAGMWVADESRERLEPAATTGDSAGIVDEIPTYTADSGGGSLSWEAYSTNTTRVIEDMDEYEMRHNPQTAIQSELIVPLGEHGLLNVGTTQSEGFSEMDVTLLELWAGTVTTVLERLERERTLREREAEISRERDRLEAFAGAVSHDLRNPLHVASSRLELLAEEHDAAEQVQPAERALDRMERLIEDLLVLAREGETVGDSMLVDLPTVVEGSWATALTADATLVCETDRRIRADRGRLAQVFENLFRNAVEHGGREVTVTVGDCPDGFYVADDGSGVPPDARDSVFESGYSAVDGGTGLGLAIVREVVTAHGWEISVLDSEDGGARFDITGVDIVE